MALQMIEVRREFESTKLHKRQLLWHLAHHGPVTDRQSGRASAKLLTALGNPFGLAHFSQVMKDLENDGYLRRETRGKRTYEIALAMPPERLAADLSYGKDPFPKPWDVDEDEPEDQADGVEEPEHEPALRMVPPAPDDLGETPDDAVGDPYECFGRAVALIARGMTLTRPLTDRPGADEQVARLARLVEEGQRRLGQQFEETTRLRRRAELAEDTVIALKQEVAGLRQKDRVMQANIEQLAKGRLDEAGFRRYDELSRLQSARPEPASAGRA